MDKHLADLIGMRAFDSRGGAQRGFGRSMAREQ